jgi:ADP-ribose pyrophosphatase
MKILEKASYNNNDFKVHSKESVYQGFIQIEKVSVSHRLFGEHTYTPVLNRELVHRKEAAGVLIYNDQLQRFALIEQFRIGAINDKYSPWQLEIIAGVLDGDEAPETCVIRESLEESGCEIYDIQHLYSFYPSAGACDEIFHLYVAQADLPEVGGIHGVPDEGENIQLHILEYASLDKLLGSQRLRNAPVIMALQWLKQHLATTSNGLR